MNTQLLIEKYSEKFKRLTESYMVRDQLGGLISGDYVVFDEKALKNKEILSKWPNYKYVEDKVKEMISSDLHIRACAIKSIRPNTGGHYGGGMGSTTDAAGDFMVDIVTEYAPGLWGQPMTVPIEVLHRVDTDDKFADVPESLKRKNNLTSDPAYDSEGVKYSKGNHPKETSLSNKNVKIPSPSKHDDKKPSPFKALPKK